MNNKIKILALMTLSSLLTACNYKSMFQKPQDVYLDAHHGADVDLYKISIKNGEYKYTYLKQLTAQSKTELSPGNYAIANECSSYQFTVAESEVRLKTNTLKIKFFSDNPADDLAAKNTDIICVNNITKKEISLSNRNEFSILPGKNLVTISGKRFSIESTPHESKNFEVELSPLRIISALKNDTTQYFIYHIQKNEIDNTSLSTSISRSVDKPVWLYPGAYKIEINGTKIPVTIEAKKAVNIQLGGIQIHQPKALQAESQTSATQPIFAYINKNVLFKLDQNYSIFPGHYSVNLDNSELKAEVDIKPGEITKIQTYAAQINPPDCSAVPGQTCDFSQKILVSKKDNPYVLFSGPLGKPFLVFHGEYQYSVEGAEGIWKTLQISSEALRKEYVGKLTVKWKLEATDKNLETRKILIEPTCCNLAGRSKDINSYKPREILMPTGEYRINYFLKHEVGNLRQNTILVRILGNTENSVKIPIYAQKNKNMHMFLEEEDEKSQEPSTLMPISP